MIYFILVFIVWLGAALSMFKSENVENKWYLEYFMLISILFLIVGGLRNEVGTDWGSYLGIFNNSTSGDSSGIEFGYLLVNKIFKFWNAPYFAFLIFIFTVSFSLKSYIYTKYSSNIFIALLVYIPILFLVYDINAIRQGLAIGILFTSLPFILNRKIIPFLLICFFAASIHVTALIFIPFYWLALKPLSDRKIIYLLAFFIFVALLSNLILNTILPLIGVDFILFEKFISYTANESYNKPLSFNLSTIYRILILLLFIFMHKKMKISNEIYLLLRNGYFLSLVIYLTFFSVELIATRGSLYFRVFDIFIFTYIVTSFKDIYMKQLTLLLLALYVSLQIFVTLNMEDNGLLPYHNFLFSW